jgi:acyl-CoA synthetase (AMP-forming)/AMP-acid ligase II/thioesterase domain-containing protein/acyl carrier protein
MYPPGWTDKPQHMSYSELLGIAQQNSLRLKSTLNVLEGSIIVVHFDNHQDNMIWFWSALFCGAIPALSPPFPVLPEQRVNHISHLDQLLKSPLYLTRRHLVEQFSGNETAMVQTIETLMEHDVDLHSGIDPLESASLNRDQPAMLMLTSGSTGNAKAVVLTHEQIFASLAGKVQSYGGVEALKAILNWIGFDHVAAFEDHFLAMVVSGTQVHVQTSDMVVNPGLFLEMVQRHRITKSFAPNFYLEKLRNHLVFNHPKNLDLHTWKVLISGGEAVLTQTLLELSKELQKYGAPRDLITPAFGMTETFAGSICNRDIQDSSFTARRTAISSVGKCIKGVEVRITPVKDATDDKHGSVELRGPAVFSGYFHNPEATSAAFTDDGYFRTGDLGFLDESGNLHLVGRAKETILVNGVHYHPDEIERALETTKIPGVEPGFFLAFDHRKDGMATECIFVVYLPSSASSEVSPSVAVHDAIVRTVMLNTGSSPMILPLDSTVLRRSSLGKLSRNKVKKLMYSPEYTARHEKYEAAIQAQKAAMIEMPENEMEHQLQSIISDYLGISNSTLSVDTQFFELGITSIDVLQIKIRIEKQLDMPIETGTLLHAPSIRSLAAVLGGARDVRYVPDIVLQPHGTGAPLWVVHPGVGDVLVFMELAKHMDRPVYALRAKGFQGEGYFTSISDAAETYFSAIKVRQPDGPYALAGYCYGAMLAFETSKLLEARGDEVRFLGSFDLPPHIAWRMRQLDWVACLAHLSFFVGLFTEEHSHEIMPLLREKTQVEAIQYVSSVGDQTRWKELALTADTLHSWTTLAHELHVIAVDYEPKGSVSSVDIFFAEPLIIMAATKTEWAAGPLAEWKHFSRGSIDMHDCPGGHYTMIDAENIGGFAKIIKKALKNRGL